MMHLSAGEGKAENEAEIRYWRVEAEMVPRGAKGSGVICYQNRPIQASV